MTMNLTISSFFEKPTGSHPCNTENVTADKDSIDHTNSPVGQLRSGWYYYFERKYIPHNVLLFVFTHHIGPSPIYSLTKSMASAFLPMPL